MKVVGRGAGVEFAAEDDLAGEVEVPARISWLEAVAYGPSARAKGIRLPPGIATRRAVGGAAGDAGGGTAAAPCAGGISRKLKVAGDLSLAARLTHYFDIPKA
ncbi:hypothetical protein ABIA32_003407 [Streptacidiphilus sp. MAP12-20]